MNTSLLSYMPPVRLLLDGVLRYDESAGWLGHVVQQSRTYIIKLSTYRGFTLLLSSPFSLRRCLLQHVSALTTPLLVRPQSRFRPHYSIRAYWISHALACSPAEPVLPAISHERFPVLQL
jgi:hypothetical protein